MYRSSFLDLGASWRCVVSFMVTHFILGERSSSTDWVGGWVVLIVDLDDMEFHFIFCVGLVSWMVIFTFCCQFPIFSEVAVQGLVFVAHPLYIHSHFLMLTQPGECLT
jgi:hypothetical protein